MSSDTSPTHKRCDVRPQMNVIRARCNFFKNKSENSMMMGGKLEIMNMKESGFDQKRMIENVCQ